MTGGMHDGVMKHVAIVTIYVDFRSVDYDRGYARRCDEVHCYSDYLCWFQERGSRPGVCTPV